MANRTVPTSIPWWQAEPARFSRDQHEVTSRFPELVWQEDGAGTWVGTLPMWPFERAEPEGLTTLLAGSGLHVHVAYRQAYPMVPPLIFPLDPRPAPLECTQHRWHVNGDSSLCQFQTYTAWDPRDSVCDLIVKAAAWRIEYALMKAGALEAMTLHGIVSDDSLDTVITEAAAATSVVDIVGRLK
jgi:hypothetical protein